MIIKVFASLILGFIMSVSIKADYNKQVKHGDAVIFFILLSVILAAIWI